MNKKNKNMEETKKKTTKVTEKKSPNDLKKKVVEDTKTKTKDSKKKTIKNKKLIIIIASIIIILLVLLVIFTCKTNNDDKTSGKSYDLNKWELVQGKEIKEENSGYDTNDYYKEYFNSTRDDNANRFWFLVPKEMTLHTISDYILEYNGPLIITFDNNYYSESFDEFFETYKKTILINLEDATIKKNNISENMMAIDIIYSESFGDVEQLVIIYREESSKIHSFVKYEIMGDHFSEAFKEKVIKNFTFEENGAKYTTCEEKTDKYECEMVINSINKKIDFTVDKDKYSVIKNKHITDYTEKFVVDGSKYINLIFTVSDSLSTDLQNLNLFGDFKSSKIKLNGKEYTKYLYTDGETPVAYYIIPLEKNIYVMMGLSHPTKDLDEIAKDFLDYKVSNIK